MLGVLLIDLYGFSHSIIVWNLGGPRINLSCLDEETELQGIENFAQGHGSCKW